MHHDASICGRFPEEFEHPEATLVYTAQSMKAFLLAGAALTAASVSLSAIAGPDFYVIEKAREAKRAEQRSLAAQVHQQRVVTSTTTNQQGATCKQGT